MWVYAMSAPRKILDLVELFQRDAAAYRSSQYNETQTRRERFAHQAEAPARVSLANASGWCESSLPE